MGNTDNMAEASTRSTPGTMPGHDLSRPRFIGKISA
jgi:hypothetical protein